MSELCKDRVVIITGAGHGLGRAYALGLAALGTKIVVNDLGVGRQGEANEGQGAAQNVVNEIIAAGGEAVANMDDVADWEAGGRIVRTALDHFGTLHAVVNNAGFVRDRMFVSATPDEWDAVMRVHLRGHFCTSRHAVDYWRAEQKRGNPIKARIINTSSGAGLQGSIGQSAYSAAKAGIAALTLVQAAELGRYGIMVNALAPNARTRMTEPVFSATMQAQENAFDPYDPANTAPLVGFLCSEDSEGVTGQIFELLGGRISLSEGWRDGPAEDCGEKFAADKIGDAVKRIIAARAKPKPVYGSV